MSGDESWLTPDQLAFLDGCVEGARPFELARLREWRDGTYFENYRPPHLAAREDET